MDGTVQHRYLFSLSCVFKAKGLKPADIGKQFAVKKIDVKKDTPAESRAATYRALTEARIAKSRCGHEVL